MKGGSQHSVTNCKLASAARGVTVAAVDLNQQRGRDERYSIRLVDGLRLRIDL